MSLLFPVLVLTVVAQVGESQPEPPRLPDLSLKKELSRLQGAWQIESFEDNGVKAAPAEMKNATIFFGRDTYLVRGLDNFLQIGVLKFNLKKTPKTIDAVVVRGPNKDAIMLGIYLLEGDTLTICWDVTGDERPKEFAAPAGSNRQLLVCKRIRSKDEPDDLAGTYRSVSTELDGTKHVAAAIVERVGDAYLVTYIKDQKVAYLGIGLRKGDVFSLSWMSQGRVGITMYRIESNTRLVGHYTQLGGPGILSEETLTRLRDDE
ncbi:MAG: TIGR03067 domain-containing protein [Gemmataceae bacterium]|nr:TIGR03067 domain-containing protein [Gemmataceae bacterium]